jgi:hypothetical protein
MKILCSFGIHKWEEIWYGYPAHHKHWHTFYRCRRCEKELLETDDLFAGPRPSNYYPITREIIAYTANTLSKKTEMLSRLNK